MGGQYEQMSVRQLHELRSLLLDRIAAVPAFRRGSLQVGYRKCGKPTCRCARAGAQGHGPRGLWSRTVKGVGPRGQYIPVEHVDQVRAELDNYSEFATLIEDYVEVNEALCKAQLPPPGSARRRPGPGSTGKKGGSSPRPGPTQ